MAIVLQLDRSATSPDASEQCNTLSVGGGLASLALAARWRGDLLIAGSMQDPVDTELHLFETSGLPPLRPPRPHETDVGGWWRGSTRFGDARRLHRIRLSSSLGLARASGLASSHSNVQSAMRRARWVERHRMGWIRSIVASREGFRTTIVGPSGQTRMIASSNLHLAVGPGPGVVSDAVIDYRIEHGDDPRVASCSQIWSIPPERPEAGEHIIAVGGDGRSADRTLARLLTHSTSRRFKILHVCSVGRRDDNPHLWGEASTEPSPDCAEAPVWRPRWFDRQLHKAARDGRLLRVRGNVVSIEPCGPRLKLTIETQAGPLALLGDRFLDATGVHRPIAAVPAVETMATNHSAAMPNGTLRVDHNFQAPALSFGSTRTFVSGSLAAGPIGATDDAISITRCSSVIANSLAG